MHHPMHSYKRSLARRLAWLYAVSLTIFLNACGGSSAGKSGDGDNDGAQADSPEEGTDANNPGNDTPLHLVDLKLTQRHETILECLTSNTTKYYELDHVLYSTGYNSTCKVGYTRPPAGARTTASVLSGDRIEAPINYQSYPVMEVDTGNEFLDQIKNAGPAQKFKLVEAEFNHDNFGQLGFVRPQDCDRIEVEVFYHESTEWGAVAKTGRLSWTRLPQPIAGQVWLADDQTNAPSAQSITRASQPQIRFWLHCSWQSAIGADALTVAAE